MTPDDKLAARLADPSQLAADALGRVEQTLIARGLARPRLNRAQRRAQQRAARRQTKGGR